MTNREFYQAVIDAKVNDDVTKHAAEAIEALDATNAKRKEKQAGKRAENLEKMRAIVAVMTTEPQTATDLAGMVHETPQKASYLCRLGVEEGVCQVVDIKISGKGTRKGYFVPAVEG